MRQGRVKRKLSLWFTTRTILLLGAIAFAACTTEQRFVAPGYSFAMTENTPAIFDDGEVAVFLVESRLELPVRAPSAGELAQLQQDAAGLVLPFPRLPWVSRHDLPFEVDFTLSNLEDRSVTVTVVFNGINEFHEYSPGVIVIDNKAAIQFSQWERLYVLDAFERRTVTVREEEIDEAAVDLATVVNGAPNSDLVVYFDSQSDHDPRVEPFIPAVIPGLVGLRAGIRTGEALRVALELSIRVRDQGDRLAPKDEIPWVLPVPALFTPVVPAP